MITRFIGTSHGGWGAPDGRRQRTSKDARRSPRGRFDGQRAPRSAGAEHSGCAEAERLRGEDGRRASLMGRVTDAGSELVAVIRSGSEQDGGRGGRDFSVRTQCGGCRRGRSDGETVGMRHVVQMERGVEDALEARHRDHENESERERAPPHDDERQQCERARREGERWRRRVVREDGAIGGVGGRIRAGKRPRGTRVRAAGRWVPRVRPGGAGQGGKQKRHAHDNDQPGSPAHGRDLILLPVLPESQRGSLWAPEA